jgi:hypothetical protein
MRRKIIVACVVACSAIIALLLWRDPEQTRTLSDGSRLTLSGVRVGRTNVYFHGSLLSKSLGRFAPSNGWSLGVVKIVPPTKVMVNAWSGSNVLSARLELFPATGRADDFLKQPFYRKYRLLVIGEDGFSYVHEFHQPYEFKQHDDGIFAYLHAATWPRTSRRLRIQLDERLTASSRDFREVAAFTIKNPRPVEAERWPASQLFRTNLPGNVDVEIGELAVRTEAPNPRDIWEHTAELPVRFTSKGQVLTNWGIHYGPMQDATGNPESFSGMKFVTNGCTVYHMFRVLDPKHPWRFDVNLALDSNYPETSLFTFDAPWPMTGKISTNFAGIAVSICYVNRDMLAVELPSAPADLRVSLVRAADDKGNNLAQHAGSWSQHRFWKLLSFGSEKRVNVRATIAIHPNYPASFILQPRYDEAKPH